MMLPLLHRSVDWWSHQHQGAASSAGVAADKKMNDPFQHVQDTLIAGVI